MIAHKFLAPGAVGPFSRQAWPQPVSGGPPEWIEASGPLVACVNGVHGCTLEELPLWLDEELWTLELDDAELVEADGLVISRRGRLVARVDGWDEAALRDFARACAERAREAADASGDAAVAAYAADAERNAGGVRTARDAAVVSYIAARGVGESAPDGVRAERRAQARWLDERLGLSA